LHLGLLANLAALYESSSRVHLRKQPFSVSSKKVGRVNAPRNVGYVFEDTRVVVEVCSKCEIAKKRVSPVKKVLPATQGHFDVMVVSAAGLFHLSHTEPGLFPDAIDGCVCC